MNNYHILQVSAVGPTNSHTACVKIKSERFKQSIKIPYTNEPGASTPSLDSAVLWLEKKGFVLIGKGESANGFYLISDTFDKLN